MSMLAEISPFPANARHVEAYSFGRHRLHPLRRELYAGDRLVEIGARAFDLLALLLANPGRVVPKREVFAAVWPTTLVDESNLRFQVAVLRRALGPDRDAVKTVSGRGYLLARPIEVSRAADHVDPGSPSGDVVRLREENSWLRRALAELVARQTDGLEPIRSRPTELWAGGASEQGL